MPIYERERRAIQNRVIALRKGQVISGKEIAYLLKDTYSLLGSDLNSDYNLALSAICHVAEYKRRDVLADALLQECIIKSRIFLYKDMLAKKSIRFSELPLSVLDSFSETFYTSPVTATVYTKEQKRIIHEYANHSRIVVSAPTSFGKTKVIEEILLHNNYKNVILVFPTIALLSEQYSKLRKSPLGDRYRISKSSRAKTTKRPMILVLTPERAITFLDDNSEFIPDFFAMDEIYKSSESIKDDRFRIFTYCLYRLAKLSPNFYLIGPFFTDFSTKFCERFDAKFIRFTTEIVQKDKFTIADLKTGKLGGTPIKIIQDKDKSLQRVLNEIKDKRSLVYRYRKDATEKTATKLALSKSLTFSNNDSLCEYIAETVSPEWSLIDCLKRGVAFHHGGIPRHIQESIIKAFEGGAIEQIVCTTSLTEGVNTSAKNVFIVDNALGESKRKLKPFERKNIEGRSGRFGTHFVGNVIYLDKIEQDEVRDYEIKLEYWDSDKIPSESLVQVDDQDLNDKQLKDKKSVFEMLRNSSIPLMIIRNNRYVDVEGQIQLINHLRRSEAYDLCRFDGSIPNGVALSNMLELTYDYLFPDSNKLSRQFTRGQAIGITKYYVGYQPPIAHLVSHPLISQSVNVNTRIRNTFSFTSGFLEFSWPKYLKAFGNLYNFVANEKGDRPINIDLLLMIIEYGTDKPHEIALKDAGVPTDIIRKVGYIFKGCESIEDLQRIVSRRRRQLSSLLTQFEHSVLEAHL